MQDSVAIVTELRNRHAKGEKNTDVNMRDHKHPGGECGAAAAGDHERHLAGL